VARENLKLAQKRMKRDYDVKVTVRELKPGDFVYQLDTATIKGKSRKFFTHLLLAPDHELRLPTYTVKFTLRSPLIFYAPLLLTISCPHSNLLIQPLGPNWNLSVLAQFQSIMVGCEYRRRDKYGGGIRGDGRRTGLVKGRTVDRKR
jgi:hypothetical protein